MPGSKIHTEALTSKAAALFPYFSRFKKFYLVGGTGLALQIGHRISVDFDFFTSEELPSNLLKRVKRLFPAVSTSVTYRAPEQLNILIDGVKTTFFYYPYPVLEPFVTYQGNSIASILEIAAMKAFVIGKRLSYKDYVDWYFLLKERHVGLGDVIALAKKKFGGDFNDRLFLGQLVSMEDIPTQKIDFLRNSVEPSTIKKLLTYSVRKFKL